MTIVPSIFGRDRVLIETLTKHLLASVRKIHDYNEPTETRRGYTFEISLHDSDDQPTDRIARVTVELDRVEQRNKEQ